MSSNVYRCPRCEKVLDTSPGSDEELSPGTPPSAYCSSCDEVVMPRLGFDNNGAT